MYFGIRSVRVWMTDLHYFHCVSRLGWAIVCSNGKDEAEKIVREHFEWDEEMSPASWKIEQMREIKPGETGIVSVGDYD